MVQLLSMSIAHAHNKQICRYLDGHSAHGPSCRVFDIKSFPRPVKSKAVYIFVLVTVTASWAWNAAVQVQLTSKAEAPSFDLGDGATFNSAFAVYICFKFFYEILQT